MQVQDERNKNDPETSDSVLVQQALAGDQGAFEALVSRYKAPLYQLIYQYVGECDEAYDVLQQVWLQLYLSLRILRPNRRIGPWLIKVARNRSIDTLRRKRPVPFSEVETADEKGEMPLQETILDTSPTPEELAEHHELQLSIQRALERAIEALPLKYRSVVVLRYKNQLDFSEIGQVLNRRCSTVKTQFCRAQPLLRTALTKQLQIACLLGEGRNGKGQQ
jgi:RNA polymerase sigma factor (sigma-70 family)